MKLQAKYNRITIVTTMFILLVTATSYYFLLQYVLTGEMDEGLKEEEEEVYDYVKRYDKLPEPTVYKDQRVSFEKTNEPGQRNFSSAKVFYNDENSNELSRQLLFPVSLHGQHYMVSVTKSEESIEGLVWLILLSTIGLIVLLTLILFFANRFLIKKLWQPFHNTLSSIKEFKLSAPAAIPEQATSITEFRELNESIRMMAEKVMKDYQSLKDFTDHASHEMQTPLAVINSKLDVLIQGPELSEASMEQVQGIYKSVEKLSRLCQSLLLLARIENNQYSTTEEIKLNELLDEKTTEMKEWLDAMNFSIIMQLDPLTVTMNRDLADILISNLLSNAVRHNEGKGSISIQTGDHSLMVSNSGKAPLDKVRVFDRFYKSDHSGGSGLGLAIVQHICEQYHFKLNYDFREGRHCFSVAFGE